MKKTTKAASNSNKDSYDFESSINTTSKIYKIYASIESVRIDTLSCGLFYDNTTSVIFQFDGQNPSISATMTRNPKSVITYLLSKVYNIDVSLATNTLDHNTQILFQWSDNNLSCHFSTNNMVQRYHRIKSQVFTYTFFMKEKE